ncbi:hypothetical protein J2T32_001215 [Kerstersia gyiorum]|nr:hypothetical protein [Kerstersia gyiorum]MCP1636205.1 hypothetical protein [Kerstersia gyiorum]MCP1671227.1 hypothetical protein [Kerstersia gyiorum]MCP1679116.1 hypothetical protein [Kerstersia gyiorum]MCP1681917.1 hypothetical protein [Kerstersia gyiorum]
MLSACQRNRDASALCRGAMSRKALPLMPQRRSNSEGMRWTLF